MLLAQPYREGDEIDPFLKGGFRALDGGGGLYNRRVRVTSGSITGADGKKIRGWVRITDRVGPDGKSREVRTEFKPFNEQRGESGEKSTIPADEARQFFRLSNPDNMGLSTFSKRNTDDEQRNDDVAKRFAARVGGQVTENAMDNGQHDAGHFSGTPEIAKDMRVDRVVNQDDGNETAVAFSGYVWQAGVRKFVSGTPKAYVKVPMDNSDPSYVASYVSGDEDNEYHEVAQTFGDIHAPRD